MNATDTPLFDLHRHLEGSIRPQTAFELARQHGLPLPAADLPGFRRALTLDRPTPDILDILPRFGWLTQALVNLDACRRVTLECLEDAAAEGLGGVEVRFSPLFMAEPHRLDPMDVTAVVCEAWQESRAHLPLHSSLTVILSRTYGVEACEVELECALRYRTRGVIGLDLAGDEARHPARDFASAFQRARDAGLHLTAHAGEFAGANSVRETVESLGVERLGHAVHAADDPTVMDLLAKRNIAVECCPTSNTLTCAVPNLAAHPLPLFLKHGLCATLNTDDPSLFGGISLKHEYRVAAEGMGLDPSALEQIRRNGVRAAFQL